MAFLQKIGNAPISRDNEKLDNTLVFLKNVRAGTKHERRRMFIIRRPYTMRQTLLLLEFFKRLKCYDN